jgi:pilus assembly protein CpaD
MRPDPNYVMMFVMPLLLALVLLVAGCTPEVARWTPAEAPKANKIDFVVMAHQVHFTPGTTTLASGEAQALSDFLSTIALSYGDQVTLDAGPPSVGAANALLARRVDAVSTVLHKLHVRAQPASHRTVDGALARDGVIVAVGRYVVTGPNCPDHSKPESDDFTNTTESDYGCATATNLGLMVANPGDLLQGAQPGPADGEAAARGVQNYRSGALSKSIKSEMPGSGSGN